MTKYIIVFIIVVLGFFFINDVIKSWQNKPVIVTGEQIFLKDKDTSAVKVTAATNTAQIQIKDSAGTVTQTTTLIPAESNYTIITSTVTGQTTLSFKNKGFCIVPIVSINYTDQINAGVGIRGFYWNAFGAYALVYSDGSLNVGVDYRLYAVKLKNVSLGISYAVANDREYTLRGGINIYLN